MKLFGLLLRKQRKNEAGIKIFLSITSCSQREMGEVLEKLDTIDFFLYVVLTYLIFRVSLKPYKVPSLTKFSITPANFLKCLVKWYSKMRTFEKIWQSDFRDYSDQNQIVVSKISCLIFASWSKITTCRTNHYKLKWSALWSKGVIFLSNQEI